MNEPTKPYFNKLQELYHGNQPCFYSVDEIEGISLLESESVAIYQELIDNLSNTEKKKFALIRFR